MDAFRKHARTLKAPLAKAQIVLEVDNEEQSLENAVCLLEQNGVCEVAGELVSDEKPLLAVLTVPEDDLQIAALKLSEAGFSRLKGIKAAPRGKEGNG